MANSCYGCQKFPIARLCRYDRREIDRKCEGCQRTTDSEYLKSMGLWINGISHNEIETSDLFKIPLIQMMG